MLAAKAMGRDADHLIAIKHGAAAPIWDDRHGRMIWRCGLLREWGLRSAARPDIAAVVAAGPPVPTPRPCSPPS